MPPLDDAVTVAAPGLTTIGLSALPIPAPLRTIPPPALTVVAAVDWETDPVPVATRVTLPVVPTNPSLS